MCTRRRWSRRRSTRSRVSCVRGGCRADERGGGVLRGRCRGRCGWPMRPGRRGSGSRGRWSGGIGCVVAAPGKIERPAAGPGQDRPPRRGAAGAAVDDRRAAPGPGAQTRGGGAARPGPGPRGRPRRSDAGPPPGRQAAAAPRRALRRATTGRSATATGWPGSSFPSRSRRSVLEDGSARSTRCWCAARASSARWASWCPARRGRRRRPVALPARHRHPLGARALRRDRRLRALPPPRAADELPRPGALGELKRREAPARARSPSPAPATPAGCWSRPPGTTAPPPRVERALRRRQDGQPQHVIAISWQAQQRLHRTWQRLDAERGKRRTIVAVAVARELAGFCWAVATAD